MDHVGEALEALECRRCDPPRYMTFAELERLTDEALGRTAATFTEDEMRERGRNAEPQCRVVVSHTDYRYFDTLPRLLREGARFLWGEKPQSLTVELFFPTETADALRTLHAGDPRAQVLARLIEKGGGSFVPHNHLVAALELLGGDVIPYSRFQQKLQDRQNPPAQPLAPNERGVRTYECPDCGFREGVTTNHQGEIHDQCPACSWKVSQGQRRVFVHDGPPTADEQSRNPSRPYPYP